MVNVNQPPYKSIEVETNTGDSQTIAQGDKITFVTEDNAEVKKGVVVNFKGTKPEKVEIEMIPEGCKHTERWCVVEMMEGSLKLQEDDNKKNANANANADADAEEDTYEE